MGGLSKGSSNSGSQNQGQFNNMYDSSNQNQFDQSSGSENQGQFQQGVWGPQGQALGGMYGQIGNLFNQTNQGMQGQIPGATRDMGNIFDQASGAWNQQLGGGAFQGMDLQGDYNRALQGGGNEQFIDQSIMGGAGNDYVGAMKGVMEADSSRNLGRNLAMSDARAAGAGMGGSSRHGMVQSNLYDDSARNLSDAQTRLGFGTFDKDLDRKLGIAQRADQFDMGRLQNVSGMLGQQQGAMAGGLNYGGQMQNLGMGQFAPQMAPWQAANQYSNIMGRPTVLGSGSGSGSGFNTGSGTSSGISTGSGFGSSSGNSNASGKGFGIGK